MNEDSDAANVQAYHKAIVLAFKALDIPFETIEQRLVAVVSDGASVMGSYVTFLNEHRKAQTHGFTISQGFFHR